MLITFSRIVDRTKHLIHDFGCCHFLSQPPSRLQLLRRGSFQHSYVQPHPWSILHRSWRCHRLADYHPKNTPHCSNILMSSHIFGPSCIGRSTATIIIISYPLTVRAVGAPQMISQPIFSIFPCSSLPSWTLRTPGLSICQMLSSHF